MIDCANDLANAPTKEKSGGCNLVSAYGGNTGSIEVLGRIESANGSITLIAPKTSISAGAQLVAGQAVQLVAASQVKLSNGQITVTPQNGDAGELTVSGAVQAAKVQLEAVNNNLGALAINTMGTVRATGVQMGEDGSIRMVAQGAGGNITVAGVTLEAKQTDGSGGSISVKADGQGGTVMVTDAKLDTSSATGKGGNIDVTGYHTGLTGSTTLDASGAKGGGSIRVGGGWQGKETDMSNASATYVGKDVQLKADATSQGDGGRVVVWADGITRYNGALSATGAGTGAGGDAEVSGKQTLAFNGTADLRGGNAQAKVGILLLDPSNITIRSEASLGEPNDDLSAVNAANQTDFSSTGSDGESLLTTQRLEAELVVAQVVIQTSGNTFSNTTTGLGTGAQNDNTPGDIWIKDPLTWNSTRSLFLQAHDDVIIDAPISAVAGLVITPASTAGGPATGRNVYINSSIQAGSINFISANDININADLTGGSVSLISGPSSRINFGPTSAAMTPVITASSLVMNSGIDAMLGASDITNNVFLRYNSSANRFNNVQISGFKNIDLQLQNNDTSVASALVSDGSIDLRARETLTLPQSTITTGVTGDLILLGGSMNTDASGFSTATTNSLGRLNLLSNVAITAGTGLLDIETGYAGGVPDFTGATLRYASATNTFGDVAILGFDKIDLNLLNNDLSNSNWLTSGSRIKLQAVSRLGLQENLRNGAASSLRLETSGSGRIEFGTTPQVFQVGASSLASLEGSPSYNGVRIISGNPLGLGASDMTNVTLQYRDGNSATAGIGAVVISGFKDINLKLIDSLGNFEPTLRTARAFGGVSIGGSGVVDAPQNFIGGGLNLYATDLRLRDSSNSTFSGPQIMDVRGLDMRVFGSAVTRNLDNVIIGPGTGGNATLDQSILLGFNNVDIRLADPSATLDLTSFLLVTAKGDVSIQNNTQLTGGNPYFDITAASVNTGTKVLSAPLTENYLRFTGTSSNPSTLNTDVGALQISGALTAPLTINEKNSLTLSALGDASSTANLQVFAQGDINLASGVNRVAGSSANLILQADANLSGIFGAGTGGSDGLGATVIKAATVYTEPQFIIPYTYTGNTFSYSINAFGVLIPGADATPEFLALSLSNQLRTLQLFGLSTAPNASGNLVKGSTGSYNLSQVGYLPNDALATPFMANGKPVGFIYQYVLPSAPAGTVPTTSYQWTSLGSASAPGGGVASVTEPITGQTLSRTGSWLGIPLTIAGDTAIVDGSVAAGPGGTNYFGNPVAGGTTLNMSGQFYTLENAGAPISYPSPTTASLTPNSSTGWARYTQTVDVSMGTGTFVAAGAGKSAAGNYVDLALGSNVDQGFGNLTNLASNARVTSNGGNAVFSGYRDITLRDANALNLGAGALSLQAGRDIILNASPVGTSASGSVALVAGGTVTTRPGVTLGGTGVGAGNLFVQAGQGTNLSTNLSAIEGGLGFAGGDGRYLGGGLTNGVGIDATTYSDLIASGNRNSLAATTAAAGEFRIVESDQGNNGLTIGNTSASYKVWNNNSRSLENVSPNGLSVTPDANPASNLTVSGNFVINQTNAAQTLSVNEAVSVPVSGQISQGEINLKSAGSAVLNADISSVGAGRQVLIQADGAITQTGGTIVADRAALSAGTDLGSAASRIQTQVKQLALLSSGNQFVSQTNAGGALNLAAATTGGGNIDVATSNGNLTLSSVNVVSSVLGGASGQSLSGVAASGADSVTLSAAGANANLVLQRDVSSTSGAVNLTASQDILFATNNAQVSTGGAASLSAARDIVNATGQASGAASRDQVVASSASLNAGRNIGSGAIDNSLTGNDNLSDFNVDVASLQVKAGGTDASGSAVLWSRNGVQLTGASGSGGATGNFGINAGGAISQAAGSILSVGGDVEFDTMRNSAIGAVNISNQGALNLSTASYAGGNYSAKSETGTVTLDNGSLLNVNGDASFNGSAIALDGRVRASGNVVQNGIISNTAGMPIASLQIIGNQAIVTAYGSTADFSLSTVLSPSVIASLGAGVDTVLVNLGSQSTTFNIAGANVSAIQVANSGNQVAGQWTVRSGTANLTNPTIDTRNYNLVDTAGAVNLGSRQLQVNAARGTDFAAGNQASSVQAVASAANTAVGFDATKGSSVNLNQTRSSGLLDVRDAYDVNVQTPTDLNVGYAHANRDLALVANAQALNDLSLQGPVFAGRHLIAVAGRDVTVTAGGQVNTVGRATFVADEAAGTPAGTGWFRNLGQIQSQSGNVAVYAVAGGQAPAGYIARPSQIVLGNIAGLTPSQPISHWNTYFQTHSGGSTQWAGFAADGGYKAGAGVYGSPQLWYKNISLVSAPVPVAPIVASSSYVPTVFQLEPGALSVVNEKAQVSGSSAAGAYGGRYSDSANMPVHFAVLGYLQNGDDGGTDSSGAYNFAPQSFHTSRVPLCFNLSKDCAPESTTTLTAKLSRILSSTAPTPFSPVLIKPLAQP